MPPDAAPYAQQFRSAADEFISYVEGLDETQASTQTDLEGWPVAVVAHHLAVAAQFVSDLALTVADGGDIAWTMEFIHDVNAQHAETFADISKQEAIEALKLQTSEAVKKIESLTVDQLQRRVDKPMPYGDGSLSSAEEIIRSMLINHVHSHLDSIKSSLSPSG